MKKNNLENFEQEFFLIKTNLEKFTIALTNQIEELLFDNNIKLGFPIQSRIKTIESIKDKIESGRFNVKKTVLELQDLVGIRIILLFKRDVESVSKLITDNLDVIKQYNTDEKLLDNQFGYSSTHFVIKIPESWKQVPTFKNLGEFIAEIQVRTISQHNWAETSNILQYKNESNVPRQMLRSISRVSALLETVDLEFERLLFERDSYNIEINKGLEKNQILNVDLLSSIIKNKLPEINKTENENYSELLSDLNAYGINTIEDLENLISENLAFALEEDKRIALQTTKESNPKFDLGVFYNRIGLIRMMLMNVDKDLWQKLNDERHKKKNIS